MRNLITVLCFLLAAPALAGTLYVGSAPTAKPRRLIEAKRVAQAVNASGLNIDNPEALKLIGGKQVQKILVAQELVASIETIATVPSDPGDLDGAPLVRVATPAADCSDAAHAVQLATRVCGVSGSTPERIKLGAKMRRFSCVKKGGERLWGIELCD